MCSDNIQFDSFEKIAKFYDEYEAVELVMIKFPSGYSASLKTLFNQYSNVSYSPINNLYGILMFYNNENDYKITECSVNSYTYIKHYYKDKIKLNKI